VSDTVMSPAERADVWQRAMDDAGGQPVNHVGTLYQALLAEVENLPLTDFRTDRANLQGGAEWRGADDVTPGRGVRVIPITGATPQAVKDRVKQALNVIAVQGEGTDASHVTDSHFLRFLEIDRAFGQQPAAFDPTFPVGTDPYLAGGPGHGPDATPIVNPTTQKWARLFNVRYRMMLALMEHALEIPPKGPDNADTPRGELVTWAFAVMLDGDGSVKDLAIKLRQLPRDQPGGPTAGAPFGLPYTLRLPALGPERWRLHLDLLDASVAIIRSIADPPADQVLIDLLDAEVARRPEVVNLLNSPF
ncbi:MAG: ferritin-like domain-containing protein, partial [Gemmataceae bacterium]